MLVSQWMATSHHYHLPLMLSSVHWSTIPRPSHLLHVPSAQLEPCGPHKCFLVNNIPVWTLHLASVNAHTGPSLINHLVYCSTLSHVFFNIPSDFTSCSAASSPAPQYLYLIMTTSSNNDEDCTELPSTLQLQFHQRTCSWKECLKTIEVRCKPSQSEKLSRNWKFALAICEP